MIQYLQFLSVCYAKKPIFFAKLFGEIKKNHNIVPRAKVSPVEGVGAESSVGTGLNTPGGGARARTAATRGRAKTRSTWNTSRRRTT
jgi:hypothetical protein